MKLKKGISFTDSQGTVYTITGLDIKNQIVKHTVQHPGQEPVPGQMPASKFKELAAIPAELEADDLVNKAPEPGNGTDTAVAQPQVATRKLTIIKGMRFEMMDKSTWKISEYNRHTKVLVAVNEKNQLNQPFTLEEMQGLVNDGHIKILS